MLSDGFKQLIAPQAKALNAIWFAFFISIFLYLGVAWMMFGQGDGAALGSPVSMAIGPFTMAQIGMALLFVLGLGATYYHRFALGTSVLRSKVPAEPAWPPPGSQANFDFGGQGTEIFGQLPESEQRLAGLWPHYLTTMVVVWATLEAIAIVGLILCIMRKDFMVVIPFAAAAALMLILKRPRPADFFANVRL